MAQESYADYSIIHRYFQQEKLHEEEIKRVKEDLIQVSESFSAAQRKLKETEDQLSELRRNNEELLQRFKDRDSDVQRLNNTVKLLNQKISSLTKGR